MSSDRSNLLEALLEPLLDSAGEHAGAVGLAAFFYYGSLVEYLHRVDFLGFIWPDLAKFFGLATVLFLIMLVFLYFVLEKAVGPVLARALKGISDPKKRENWEGGLGFGAAALIIVLFALGCLWCWSKVYASGSETEGPTLAGVLQPKDGPIERTAARSAPVKDSFMGPITDPEIAVHLTRQIRRTSLDRDPIVVVSLDGERAWIKLNGTIVNLPLAVLEGVPESRIGNRFSRQFASNDISLLIQYEVLSSSVIQDMGCERTEYRLSIDLSGRNIKDHIEPESYGEGC